MASPRGLGVPTFFALQPAFDCQSKLKISPEISPEKLNLYKRSID